MEDSTEVRVQNERETMTTAQVVQVLGVSRMTVWRLLEKGDLKGRRMTSFANSRWLVYTDSVENYLRGLGV